MNINLTSDPAALNDKEAFIMIEDNVQSMKILTDAGILGLLQPEPPNNAAFCFFQTDTHWCCGALHQDFAETKDNGYSVCMLPKMMTIFEANRFFAEVISATSETKEFEFAVVEFAKHDNN